MSLGRKIFLLKPTLIYLIRKSSFILLDAHLNWLLNLKIYKLKENPPINRKKKASVIKETKEWCILCCFCKKSIHVPTINSQSASFISTSIPGRLKIKKKNTTISEYFISLLLFKISLKWLLRLSVSTNHYSCHPFIQLEITIMQQKYFNCLMLIPLSSEGVIK